MVYMDFHPVNGLVLLDARVDGEKGQFLLDTGAMMTALNAEYFSPASGGAVEIAKFSGSMSAEDARKTRILSLELQNTELHDLDAMCMDLGYAEAGLRTEDGSVRLLGLLGNDVLRGYSLFLDYKAGLLALDSEMCFRDFTLAPMPVDAFATVELVIGDRPRRFVLDTGANACLLDAELQGEFAVTPAEGAPGQFTLPRVRLEDLEYRDVTAVFADLTALKAVADVCGVIGSAVLSPRRTIQDFKRQLLFLEK